MYEDSSRNSWKVPIIKKYEFKKIFMLKKLSFNSVFLKLYEITSNVIFNFFLAKYF